MALHSNFPDPTQEPINIQKFLFPHSVSFVHRSHTVPSWRVQALHSPLFPFSFSSWFCSSSLPQIPKFSDLLRPRSEESISLTIWTTLSMMKRMKLGNNGARNPHPLHRLIRLISRRWTRRRSKLRWRSSTVVR